MLDSALAHLDVFDVVDVEPRLEVELERTGTIGGTVELGSRGPAQTAQDITLANHHIYGSSRVGLHNYWQQQYYSSWNFKEGVFDTSLNKRRPWYSLPSNELVDTNYSDPWGHGLARSITAEHILGLRQYELTNQTQNVMAVVLDKRFIKTTGNGNRDRFMASISAAYDYYPYGMLMPGRTTADTTTHCMTVMKEFKSAAPFPKAADMSKAVATLGGTFTPPAGGGLMGGTVVYGKSGGLKLDLTVVPGDAIDVRTDVSWLTGFGVTVTVSETTASGVKRTLGSKTISFPGLVTLPVRPSVNKITLTIDNMSSFVTAPTTGVFSVGSVSYDSLAYWSQWSPVTICDKNVDKYPFGFNGQMKSNDVAGIGNFNTAEFWEYNTRTGRRLNLDPIPQVSMSDYSVMGGNPIVNSDVKGDTWTVGTDAATKADVKNIPNNSGNSKYVKVADDGKVSLDFGDLNQEKIDKIIEKDDGLALIKNLVSADENYYYSTGSDFNSQGLKETKEEFVKAGGSGGLYERARDSYVPNSWRGLQPLRETAVTEAVCFKNASTTTYGNDSKGNPVPTLLPKKGYDGQVGFAQGLQYIKTFKTEPGAIENTTVQRVNYEQIRYRSIRHELWENYYRTTGQKAYNDAHNAANGHSSGENPVGTYFMYTPFMKFPVK